MLNTLPVPAHLNPFSTQKFQIRKFNKRRRWCFQKTNTWHQDKDLSQLWSEGSVVISRCKSASDFTSQTSNVHSHKKWGEVHQLGVQRPPKKTREQPTTMPESPAVPPDLCETVSLNKHKVFTVQKRNPPPNLTPLHSLLYLGMKWGFCPFANVIPFCDCTLQRGKGEEFISQQASF